APLSGKCEQHHAVEAAVPNKDNNVETKGFAPYCRVIKPTSVQFDARARRSRIRLDHGLSRITMTTPPACLKLLVTPQSLHDPAAFQEPRLPCHGQCVYCRQTHGGHYRGA